MTDINNQLSVCMLASGSKGNAIYISDGVTTLLMDAGLSGIEIERRLQAHNLDKDYMLRRHFSIWSEFPDIIRTEENGRRRRRFRIVYRCHNIAGVLLLIFLLFYLVIERF